VGVTEFAGLLVLVVGKAAIRAEEMANMSQVAIIQQRVELKKII
jgi:hypothetical protein